MHGQEGLPIHRPTIFFEKVFASCLEVEVRPQVLGREGVACERIRLVAAKVFQDRRALVRLAGFGLRGRPGQLGSTKKEGREG